MSVKEGVKLVVGVGVKDAVKVTLGVELEVTVFV